MCFSVLCNNLISPFYRYMFYTNVVAFAENKLLLAMYYEIRQENRNGCNEQSINKSVSFATCLICDISTYI